MTYAAALVVSISGFYIISEYLWADALTTGGRVLLPLALGLIVFAFWAAFGLVLAAVVGEPLP